MRSILVFLASGIGDAVLAVPTLKSIRDSYPTAWVTLVISRRSYSLLGPCPYADEVLSIEMDGIGDPWKLLNGEGLVTVLQLLRHLRGRRFDGAVDLTRIGSLMGSLKRALFYFLAGVRDVAGRDTRGLGFFLSRKVRDGRRAQTHEVHHCLEVAARIGARPPANPRLELFLDESDRARAARLLPDDSSSLRLALNPGGFRANRRWMPERFAEVACRLRRRQETEIVLLGGPRDAALAREIAQRLDAPVLDLAGKTGLPLLAAVLERCHVILTNDSGPMHIAAAVGTPVAAIFGPGDLVRYAPFCPESEQRILRTDRVPCVPCLQDHCNHVQHLACLTAVEASQAVDAILELAGQGHRSHARGRIFSQGIEIRAPGFDSSGGL